MKQQIETRLATAVQDLPPEKILQVIDFAGYLRSKYALDAPQRGSSEAILQALEQAGPLQFAPEELDTLLAEIQMWTVSPLTTGASDPGLFLWCQ